MFAATSKERDGRCYGSVACMHATRQVLRRIGEARGRSVEEVALRWVVQGGCAVSVRPTADFGMGSSKCVPPRSEPPSAASREPHRLACHCAFHPLGKPAARYHPHLLACCTAPHLGTLPLTTCAKVRRGLGLGLGVLTGTAL